MGQDHALKEEQRQRQIAESLQEVAIILNSSLDRDTVLSKILEQLHRVIDYDGASILLPKGADLVVWNTFRSDAAVGFHFPLAGNNPSVRKGTIKLETLDMAEIVEQVQQRLTFMIDEYRAEILLPESWPVAQGYAPWVEEVWANYMSNGLKYGGRPPRLALGASLEEEGMIRFWIRDNGPGLAPEAQAQLVGQFTRLDETRATGHGLGLSIVKRIVEKLGGQVGVESKGIPGEGSVFSFTLPGF